MKTLTTLGVMLTIAILPTQASADFVQGADDLLAADTVDMVVTVAPDAAGENLKLQLDQYVFCDGRDMAGISMGFTWDNPNLQMDSAVISHLVDSVFDFYSGGLDYNLASTNANQRFKFGGVALPPLLTPVIERRLMASYYFTLSSWSANDSIVIDTLCWDGGSLYTFVSSPFGAYKPYWTGRLVIYDTPATCCAIRVGDANCSGNDEPTIGDMSRISDFLFGSHAPLCCLPEADVNQSGGANPTDDDITIGDMSILTDYLFITGPSLGLADCF